MQTRRALVSVSNKEGLVPLCQALAAAGIELVSTGGTAAALKAAGLPVTSVASVTGAPEILDGRVKTLHPKIHGGILARDTTAHRATCEEHGIAYFDVVIVNLYPFVETVAAPQLLLADAIEQIDIGGPAMIRAAAKNCERVVVVVDPADYPRLIAEVSAATPWLTPATRRELAAKAFAHTAAYDGAIASFLTSVADGEAPASEPVVRSATPGVLSLQGHQLYPLRYGENAHQAAALYKWTSFPVPAEREVLPTVTGAQVLGGKQISYNNVLDLDAALGLVLEFAAPAAVVVKHNNPCGAATLPTLSAAYLAAREADATSAFGGIVALNRVVDDETAALLGETFLECVIAPGFSEGARALLASKKNLRLLEAGGDWLAQASHPGGRQWQVRSIRGGVLLQELDAAMVNLAEARVVTKAVPSEAQRADLQFAWKVAKHVKSNAIVFAAGGVTLAIGAGQMSRVDAVRICERKGAGKLAGAAVASDAFFPFRDGVDVLAGAGAASIVQPGGSVRDEEVIAAANEHGLAMMFTGMRHFRH
ncbi:MAG: bifunctional phosphoribosylaminoimidazolecarboxamide formyltransferase/IMP cyclohydrolase [Myxococcales bacterium]|nr:bifunctional phosphoribosylaminoimidazolecarboxamide formyltransferase/IMP cyclohydrolase [Myxococcales bacterium]